VAVEKKRVHPMKTVTLAVFIVTVVLQIKRMKKSSTSHLSPIILTVNTMTMVMSMKMITKETRLMKHLNQTKTMIQRKPQHPRIKLLMLAPRMAIPLPKMKRRKRIEKHPMKI